MHGYRCLSLIVVKIGTEARQTAEPLSGQIRAMRIYISRPKMRIALLPVPACRVLEIAIDDLEGPGERHAQPAHDLRQSSLGVLGISEVQRRLCGELIEGC
jgi:hypothetical protein